MKKRNGKARGGILLDSTIWLVLFSAVVMAFLVLLFIYGAKVQPVLSGAACHAVYADDADEIESPMAPTGSYKRYTILLDDRISEGDTCIAFYARHQYVRVYLDEEKVYSLERPSSDYFSKTVGSNWVIVPLQAEDVGKKLSIDIVPVYESHEGRAPEFMIGSSMDIYAEALKADLLQIILGAFAVLVGVIFLVTALVHNVRHATEKRFHALGAFSLLIGFWRLTDVRFAVLWMPQHALFLTNASIVILMVFMMPLAVYITCPLPKRIVTKVYCVFASVTSVVLMSLQFLGIRDLRETLQIAHLLIVLGIVCILAEVFINRKSRARNEKGVFRRVLPAICVAGVVLDFAFYLIADSSSSLIATLALVIVYIIFSGIMMILDHIAQEKKLLERENELVEARVQLMLSQIQPHFLYNALNSIAELCREDAEKARSATIDFADYLRTNLKALKMGNLTPFSTELAHVKRYLSLEKMCYEERLNIVYDIGCSDFALPQLSVQPLVENAVKHGIGKKEQGGTIAIRTWEENNAYMISVEDDGVGFDARKLKDDGQVHIGIDSARSRLAHLCGGTLEIFSKPGMGCRVVIRIPGEEDE